MARQDVVFYIKSVGALGRATKGVDALGRAAVGLVETCSSHMCAVTHQNSTKLVKGPGTSPPVIKGMANVLMYLHEGAGNQKHAERTHADVKSTSSR